MVVVPIDERTLGRAVELGTLYGLRTVDAVHLAALDRLPRPLGLATLTPARSRRRFPSTWKSSRRSSVEIGW